MTRNDAALQGKLQVQHEYKNQQDSQMDFAKRVAVRMQDRGQLVSESDIQRILDRLDKTDGKVDQVLDRLARVETKVETLTTQGLEQRAAADRLFREGCSKREQHEASMQALSTEVNILKDRPTRALAIVGTIAGIVGSLSGLAGLVTVFRKQ